MQVISLGPSDLSIAALLILLLAFVSYRLRLGLERKILWAALRTTLQLLLIGLVLRFLFGNVNIWFMIGLSLIMLLIAGREVWARQRLRVRGFYGYGVGVGSLFISSFSVTYLALVTIIQVDPWYTPQYAIPLLGMLLGNTMTGVSLASDTFTGNLYEQRGVIEQRLCLGETWQDASREIRSNCMRVGMVPIINSMAAAGVVSLPGMMTGQILGGTPPIEAVKYQILIMFLISAGTGFGVIGAIWMMSRHLFDKRHRLCLEKLERTSSSIRRKKKQC